MDPDDLFDFEAADQSSAADQNHSPAEVKEKKDKSKVGRVRRLLPGIPFTKKVPSGGKSEATTKSSSSAESTESPSSSNIPLSESSQN